MKLNATGKLSRSSCGLIWQSFSDQRSKVPVVSRPPGRRTAQKVSRHQQSHPRAGRPALPVKAVWYDPNSDNPPWRRITFQPPCITDCRRCIASCFCLCESPSIVFGPIAMGPACIGFSRKRSPISRCARSFHRSASPNHFQLCARSNMARWRHNLSI